MNFFGRVVAWLFQDCRDGRFLGGRSVLDFRPFGIETDLTLLQCREEARYKQMLGVLLI